MPVQQIYCTHCTYGTSVLELRAGDVADRVLGYSARAASLDRHELKGYYRQIERFLNYYLPADTPPEEKSRLDANTAPRRFFFYPALGNLQMVGQVSYRQSDTAGRIGSYFAHVLFAPLEAIESQPQGSPALAAAANSLPNKAVGDSSTAAVAAVPKRTGNARRGEKREAWPAAKCLQLWDAPWVVADSPNLPLELPPLDSIDALWNGQEPVLNDELLLTFLQTPAAGEFFDPANIISERWRAKEPAERADLLVQAMQGLLDLGSHRRDNVLLVVEPSVAALAFYGIARLVPPAVLEGVSFSTYEPSADRLAMTVAATTFFSPDTSDVRPDLYRRRGFVWNTYSGRMSDTGRPLGEYARFVVDQLLAGGWQVADRLVRGFANSGVRHPEELAVLIGTHHQVDQLLSATPLPDEPWRSSPVAETYLRGEVRRRLAEAPPGWPELHVVAGSPNHLPVLELVACESAPTDLHGPAQYLLRKLPAEKFPEMLASPRIAESAKLDALQHYVISFNRLPEECQSLWSEEAGAAGRGTAPARPLLEKLLARLPEQVLSLFRSSVPAAQWKAFLRIAMRAGRIESRSQAAIKRLVLEVIVGLDDVRLVEALIEHGDALPACCPPPEPTLGKRLHRILYDLPEHPTHFSTWLDTLSGWTDYFSDPGMAEQRLGHWRKIRAVLLSLRDGEPEQPSGLVDKLRKKTPPDYRGLAESLGRAMPMASYPDDATGKRKQAALLKIGMAILNRSDVLPALVWSRMTRFFEYGDWDEGGGRGGGKKHRKKKPGQRSVAAAHRRHRTWLVYGGIIAGTVVLMVAVGWGVMHFRGMSSGQATPAKVARAGGETANAPANSSAAPPTVAGNQSSAPVAQASQSTAPLPQQSSPTPSLPSSRDGPYDGASSNDGKPEPTTPDGSPPSRGAPTNEPSSAPCGEKTSKPEPIATAPETEPAAASDSNAAKAGGTSGKTAAPPEPPPSGPPPPEPPPPDPPPTSVPQNEPALAEENDILVGESFELPSFEHDASKAYDRIAVQEWRKPPQSVKLSLLGLDFVNQQLDGERQLATDSIDGELKVNLKRTGDKRSHGPSLLATFQRDEEGLWFRWTELEKGDSAGRGARELLRRCVLQTDAVWGDGEKPPKTETHSYALVNAVDSEPITLESGSGIFDQRGWKLAPFPPLHNDDLVLGPGYVAAPNRARFPFGQHEVATGAPYLITNLPEEFKLRNAEIDWRRDGKDPNRWHIEISVPGDNDILQRKREFDNKWQLLLEEERWYKKHAQPLRHWINEKARVVNKATSDKLNEHSVALAEHLEIAKPQPCFETTDTGDRKALDKALSNVRDGFSTLVTQSAERQTKLRKECVEIEEAIHEARRGKRREMERFWANANSLSAIIYRRVDDHVLAPYAILGNPEGEAGPTPPPRLNDRVGFDDGDDDDDE